MKKKITSKITGFILVETVVAVSLVMMTVPAVLGMVTKGITLSSYAKNQMIATYLAEEGIEFIIARRDYNYLRKEKGDVVNWDDGFVSGTADCRTVACTINPTEAIKIVSGSGSIYDPNPIYRLYVDSNGFYKHDSAGTITPFSRGVFVKDVSGNPDEHTITSVVVWNTPFSKKSISVTAYITNWF
jgi:hypothetical protein